MPELTSIIPWTENSASTAAKVDFYEDTDNGTNKITVAAPSSIASNRTQTLPDKDGTFAMTTDIDTAITGLDWKASVRVATTGAGTLASSFENGDTVDGVALATGDRILIKDQASATENGIYTVNASGAPTRATDADSGAELVNATVFVEAGTTNADRMYVCTNNQTPTLGVTNITFTQFTSGGGSVDDTAYNEATWNGDTTNAPSKNAVRDILETRSTLGKHSFYMPSGILRAAVTNGPGLTQIESTTNKINYYVWDFDGTTQETVHFNRAMPKDWDKGTVTFQVYWETTNTGTAGVAWGLQGVALSDGDTKDSAFGTAVYVVDNAQSSAAKQYVTAESAAVTIAGSPANDDIIHFRILRDPTNGSDNMTEDARLIGIKIIYTTNAATEN